MKGSRAASCSWILYLMAVSFALEVTESPASQSVLIGQTAQFSCTLSRGKARVFYWRRIPLFPNGTWGHEEDVIGGIQQQSNSSSVLVIKNVSVSDAGKYICTAFPSCPGNSQLVVGRGAELSVKAIPKLEILSDSTPNKLDHLTLTCRAMDFYPPNVTLLWDHSLPGVPHTAQQESPTSPNNGKFSSSSVLHVNTSLWRPEKEIGCLVNHSSVTQLLKKYIKRPVALKVNLTSEVSFASPDFLTLTCSAVGFYPSNVTLSWDHSLPTNLSYKHQEMPTLLQDGTYSSSSSLQVNSSVWIPGTEIGCEVNHSSLIQPLRETIRRGVIMLTVQWTSDFRNLTCSAVGFYPPSVSLTWHHSLLGIPNTTELEDPKLLQDGTYSRSTTMQFNASLWSPGIEIGCEANHSSLIQPLRKNLTSEEQQSAKYVPKLNGFYQSSQWFLRICLLFLGLMLLILPIIVVHFRTNMRMRSVQQEPSKEAVELETQKKEASPSVRNENFNIYDTLI